MATRSGSVDPGLVLWLLRRGRRRRRASSAASIARAACAGLAGDADMRAVLARDDDDARLAIDVYVHRLRAGIAAMAAALGGLDALVFTGGVGEHAPQIRARTAAGLGFLGVELDAGGQRRATGDAEIGAQRRVGALARGHRARGPRGRPPGAGPARRSLSLMCSRMRSTSSRPLRG